MIYLARTTSYDKYLASLKERGGQYDMYNAMVRYSQKDFDAGTPVVDNGMPFNAAIAQVWVDYTEKDLAVSLTPITEDAWLAQQGSLEVFTHWGLFCSAEEYKSYAVVDPEFIPTVLPTDEKGVLIIPKVVVEFLEVESTEEAFLDYLAKRDDD